MNDLHDERNDCLNALRWLADQTRKATTDVIPFDLAAPLAEAEAVIARLSMADAVRDAERVITEEDGDTGGDSGY